MLVSFFEENVKKICDELEAAQHDKEGYATAHDDAPVSRLTSFPAISAEDLRKIIPTKILKECIEQLLPTLLKIINTSLATSTVPKSNKQASTTSLLKKKKS